jgi:hypothetical protein
LSSRSRRQNHRYARCNSTSSHSFSRSECRNGNRRSASDHRLARRSSRGRIDGRGHPASARRELGFPWLDHANASRLYVCRSSHSKFLAKVRMSAQASCTGLSPQSGGRAVSGFLGGASSVRSIARLSAVDRLRRRQAAGLALQDEGLLTGHAPDGREPHRLAAQGTEEVIVAEVHDGSIQARARPSVSTSIC